MVSSVAKHAINALKQDFHHKGTKAQKGSD
jgi:hypothetical protein